MTLFGNRVIADNWAGGGHTEQGGPVTNKIVAL